MRLIDWVPARYRSLALVLALVLLAGLSAGGAWQVQDWRYGKALAEQAGQVDQSALKRAEGALAALAIEQDKRGALERRLRANDETHYKALKDAKETQQRLSDGLATATATVRLSVLLAAGPGRTGGDGLPAPASAGGVVHGATRAELDPAHAQRIISITDTGDRGLIALAACQAYAKEVSTPK